MYVNTTKCPEKCNIFRESVAAWIETNKSAKKKTVFTSLRDNWYLIEIRRFGGVERSDKESVYYTVN
jgi:hypothetical protein